MRGLLAAYNASDRKVIIADPFEGLPPPDGARFPADAGDRHHKFQQLAIPLKSVQAHFAAYGLLDDRVEFLKGWFSDTLPTLTNRHFALIRLDGDMYQSTIEALDNLYDQLSPGGFVIIDDYGAVRACRAAVDDFRGSRNINKSIEKVDWTGAWWRKTR